MGDKNTISYKNARFRLNLKDSRGVSLLLIIFLVTVVAAAAVGVLTMGVKLRDVKKEDMVMDRLDVIHRALQRYYLSHHDLPPSFNTTPPYTVPAKALSLPQEYRFDKAGQFIRYDRFPFSSDTLDITGLTVNGKQVAAVLVAPGYDRKISDDNSDANGTDYIDAEDDIVVSVPLNAEAMKIATRAVAVLQAAAKAYDGQFDVGNYDAQFDNKNNDGDINYTPIDPGVDGVYGTPDDVPPPIWVDPDGIPANGDEYYNYHRTVNLTPDSVIDEDDYAAAIGGSGTGCVRYDKLDNDPERGTASLDGCATAAHDIVAVFGLSERYITDPWGNAYQWGSAGDYGGIAQTAVNDDDRDRHYWSFYSMGPDGTSGTVSGDTLDDITPTTDFIVGYHGTDPTP